MSALKYKVEPEVKKIVYDTITELLSDQSFCDSVDSLRTEDAFNLLDKKLYENNISHGSTTVYRIFINLLLHEVGEQEFVDTYEQACSFDGIIFDNDLTISRAETYAYRNSAFVGKVTINCDIEESMFERASFLDDVIITSNCTHIDRDAFALSNINTITIPKANIIFNDGDSWYDILDNSKRIVFEGSEQDLIDMLHKSPRLKGKKLYLEAVECLH